MGTSNFEDLKPCYLFGAGPGLDLVDWDTIEYPRYAINLAALVVPNCTAIIAIDHSMLKYFERKQCKTKIYTFASRHSYNLNLEYVNERVPIYCRMYSTLTAISLLKDHQIHAYGFDAMKNIHGYASVIKLACTDYTDLNRGNSHKPICVVVNKYIEKNKTNIYWH